MMRKTVRIASFSVCLGALGSALAAAGADPADTKQGASKRGYHLFNPVPEPLQRDLSSDRPDQTESAYTVDAGHFQVEVDLFSYTRDRYKSDRTDVLESGFVAPNLNLKSGVLNNMDFQFVFPVCNRLQAEDRTGSAGGSFSESGTGDIRLRAKVNLCGNDGGRTALSFMPFILIPTGSGSFTRGVVEGGLIFPFTFELRAGFECGAMGRIDFLRDDSGAGSYREFVQSVTFGRSIGARFSGYAEFFTAVNPKQTSDWVGTVDFGINWLLETI